MLTESGCNCCFFGAVQKQIIWQRAARTTRTFMSTASLVIFPHRVEGSRIFFFFPVFRIYKLSLIEIMLPNYFAVGLFLQLSRDRRTGRLLDCWGLLLRLINFIDNLYVWNKLNKADVGLSLGLTLVAYEQGALVVIARTYHNTKS